MDLSLAEFVTGVLAFAGAAVLVASLLSWWRGGLAEKRALARRVSCRWCLHVFEEEARGIVPCPRCGAQNRKDAREGKL